MKLKPEKKLHAKYSASGSDRWLNCSAAPAMAEDAPKQEDSAQASEGTDAHTCLEVIMQNRYKPLQAAEMLKRRYPPTMVDHALETYRMIYKLVPKGAELLSETQVRLDFVEPGTFGTVDVAIVEPFGTLWVIDYKYGKGRLVSPEENSQNIFYALGLAHKYAFNFERVRLGIAQPRIVHRDGFFRTWDMSIKDLMRWEKRFKRGVEACKDPLAELNPGRWCFFCPAQSICPAVENKFRDDLQNSFDEVVDS